MVFFPSQFGLRQIRQFDVLDYLGDGSDTNDFRGVTRSGGGGLVTIQTNTTVNTVVNTQDVGGGLTPGQIDQVARFETQEGANIGFFYGRILFAGNLVSKLYEPGPGSGLPRNTFTVILGEGWGGLGAHGEWNRIVKAYYRGEELTKRSDAEIWFDDRLPQGAIANPDTDGWNWVSKSPTPFLGKLSHQSPNLAGVHQHFFTDATQGLAIQTGDIISCWIWIDPINTPTAIMLQFALPGDFEHRAYWGPNVFTTGTNGTNSRRQISASIPSTGSWVRLDVPAVQVGLEGQTITGMAFTLHGGAATWDLVVRWQQTLSGNSGYLFRPGIITTNLLDIVQVQHLTTWPSGLAYSGSANVTVRLSETQSAEDRPDGFKCIAECRKVYDYDATGAELPERYGYSANPARVAADRILFFFQRRYRDNLDIAQQRFRARIDWPSWTRWRDYCDQLIPWDREDDGVNVFVPRFEANIGFNADLLLADALDQLCGISATFWQDDGQQLIFKQAADQTPVHHFHSGNITGAPTLSLVDLRERPNRFIAKFRDTDDVEFLGPAAIEPPDNTPQDALRADSINRVGEIRSEREFSNMTQSQAQRLIEYRARLEHDYQQFAGLTGMAPSIKVLPGDYVTVSHDLHGWNYQLFLVVAATIKSADNSADEVEFTLQKIDGPLYDDTYHRPRQEALTLS